MVSELESNRRHELVEMRRPAPPIPENLAILPLFDTVVFPGTVAPMAISQVASIRLVDEAVRAQELVGLVTLKSATARPAAIGADDCYLVGTAAIAHRLLRLPDGTLRVAMEGVGRFTIEAMSIDRPYLRAQVRVFADESGDADEQLLATAAIERVERLARLAPRFSAEALAEILAETDPQRLGYLIAATALQHLPLAERQGLLEVPTTQVRLHQISTLLDAELSRLATRPILQVALPLAETIPEAKADDITALNETLDQGETQYYRYAAAAQRQGQPGVAIGLTISADQVTTVVVEALAVPGQAGLEIIGPPAAAESAVLAWAWLRTHADSASYQPAAMILHLPVAPASANDTALGATLALAMASALWGRSLRPHLMICAMPTLHGWLLPPTNLGLRLAAACRFGFKTLILPSACRAEAEQLADQAAPLRLVFVEDLRTAIEAGLAGSEGFAV